MPDPINPIGNDPFTGSTDPNQSNNPVNENSDSLANGFLKNVAEADRPVVEKYLKDWDAGVTRRFQDIHNNYKQQLAPYSGYDPEAVQQALSVVQILNDNPQQFYLWLYESLGENVPEIPGMNQQGNQQQQDNTPAWAEGLPPQFVEMYTQQQQQLEAMAGHFQQFMESQQQASQDAELDNLLSSMKQKHGDFDEDYVIAKMLKGASPDDAVNAYKALIGNASNGSNRRPAPTVLGGYGSVPSTGGKPLASLSHNETKNLVAQMLGAAHQS